MNFPALLRNLPVLDNPDLFIEILEDLPGDEIIVEDEREDDVVPTEENTTEEPTNSNEETIKESSENVSSEEYVEFEEDSSDSEATEDDFKDYFRTILISNADPPNFCNISIVLQKNSSVVIRRRFGTIKN